MTSSSESAKRFVNVQRSKKAKHEETVQQKAQRLTPFIVSEPVEYLLFGGWRGWLKDIFCIIKINVQINFQASR